MLPAPSHIMHLTCSYTRNILRLFATLSHSSHLNSIEAPNYGAEGEGEVLIAEKAVSEVCTMDL